MSNKLDNLPMLDEYITLGEAAELLGISRQHAYRRAKLTNDGLKGGWSTVKRLGHKPAYVVSLVEVMHEVERSLRT